MVVKIKFKSAKIILQEKGVTDLIFDQIKDFRDRTHFNKPTDSKFVGHPFEMEQVSNLLHVLFGQRPVPTHQSTIRKRLPVIDEIAKTAWFRIENLYYYNKKGKPTYITSFHQGKKIRQNSNRKDLTTIGGDNTIYKGSIITWSMLYQKYFLNNRKKYNDIMEKFKELYGSKNFSRDYALVDLIRYLVDEKGYGKELIKFFDDNKLGPLKTIAEGKIECNSFNEVSHDYHSNLDLSYRVLNIHQLEKMSLNGSIIVEVPDKFMSILFGGNRFATFLEGGMAELADAMWGSVESIGISEGYRPLCV